MAKRTVANPVGAKVVREWFREDLSRLSSAADADLVREGRRGKLNPAIVEQFNKATGVHGNVYSVDASTAPKTKDVSYKHTQKNGRKVTRIRTLTISEIRELSPSAGVAGRISDKSIAEVVAHLEAESVAALEAQPVVAKPVVEVPVTE